MSSTYNISAVQGSTLLLSLTANDSNGSPIDLNGYSARGYVKYRYSDTGSLLDLSPVVTPPYGSGIITLSGNSVALANMPVGTFVYDLEVYAGDYVVKFLKGYFYLFPESTV
jgi:hypothetical protein